MLDILSAPHSRVLFASLHIMPQGHLPNLGDHITCPAIGARMQVRGCSENPPIIRKGVHDAPSALREDISEHEWNFPTGPRPHSTDHDDASPISATHSHFTLFLSSCLLGSHPLSRRKLLLLEDSRMGTQVGLLLSTVNVSLNSRKRLVVDIWV